MAKTIINSDITQNIHDSGNWINNVDGTQNIYINWNYQQLLNYIALDLVGLKSTNYLDPLYFDLADGIPGGTE